MIAQISCSSTNILTQTKNDSIVSITVSDLRYANLIFVEHKKLTIDNTLLQKQILNLNELNMNLNKIDSLKTIQLNNYTKINSIYLNQINKLNKEINKSNNTLRYWQIGGIVVSLGFILAFLIK